MKGDESNKEKAVNAVPQARPAPDPAGDSIAALFEQHHELVFRAARRITGTTEDAEDVVQTVFLRVMRREDPRLREQDASHYLQRAAHNAALDVLRRRKAARSDSIEDASRLEDHAPGPESMRDAAAIRDRVREALADLNPRAAEIFILRYIDGYGNREIARLLQTSWGTVAVTLYRTRAKLQQALKGELR